MTFATFCRSEIPYRAAGSGSGICGHVDCRILLAATTLTTLEREALEKKYAKMSREERNLADPHDEDARVRQYYVFVTIMGEGWIGGDPHRVAEFYRGRGGSRTPTRATRLRITSTDYSVRILLWLIPFILYNVWILARFMAARGRAYLLGTQSPITLNLFVSMVLKATNMQPASNPGGRPPD